MRKVREIVWEIQVVEKGSLSEEEFNNIAAALRNVESDIINRIIEKIPFSDKVEVVVI